MWDGTKIILQIHSDLKANSLWWSTSWGSELLSKYEYFSVHCLLRLCTVLVVELVCIRCFPDIWNSLFRQDHIGVTVKYLSAVKFSKQSCRHSFFLWIQFYRGSNKMTNHFSSTPNQSSSDNPGIIFFLSVIFQSRHLLKTLLLLWAEDTLCYSAILLF